MSISKRLLALLCAAALLLCACSGAADTQWIAKSGEDSYSIGIYKVFQLHGISEIISSFGVDYTQALTTSVSLDGMTGSEYVSIYADGELAWLATVDRLFEQYSLAFDELSNWQPESYSKTEYESQSEYYDALGIAQDDLYKYYESGYKVNLLFEALYATKGGEFEVSADTLYDLMDKTYTRINYIYLSEYDLDTGTPYSEEKIAEQRQKAADYLTRWQNGEDFLDLYHENYLEYDSTGVRHEDYYYDIYLPKQDDGTMPPEFFTAAAQLAENEAKLIEGDGYSAVMLRLPVNDVSEDDLNWQSVSLKLLYNEYSEEFNAWLSKQVDEDTSLKMNEKAKALHTPESLVSAVKKYYLTHES